jgi:hypothetical protein
MTRRQLIVFAAVVWGGMSAFVSADMPSDSDLTLVRETFEGYSPGTPVSAGHWTTDWPGTLNTFAASPSGGRALAVKAINGVNSAINFDPQEGGVLKCSFDWTPHRGQWTFFGFKAPGAAWDKYQAAVLFEPVGGNVYVFKGNDRVKVSTRPLRPGDATSPAVYHVTMTVQPRAADKKPGRFRVEVAGQEGVVAATGTFDFPNDALKPVSMFEIRSVRWCEPKDEINGLLDNLVIGQDITAVPVRLELTCDKWGHVYYHGRPVTVVGTVTNLTGKRIESPVVLTVTNPYGRTVLEKSRTVALGPKEKAAWRETLSSPGAELYGLYRIRAGAGPEAVRIYQKSTFAVIAPPNDKVSGFDSHFGAFQYPLHSEDAFQEKIIEQMHDLGIRWLRINFHWYNHEPEKGKFDWDGGFPMGTFTDLAYRHRMHVMAELAYTARWASSKPHDERVGAIDTGTFWASVAPKDFADWENYCRKAAERFKGKVKYYEIWNECGAPKDYKNFNGFWRDSSDNFVRILKYANKGVKSVDPQAGIVAAGFRAVDMGVYFDNFVERVVPKASDYIDVISFHGAGSGAWGTKFYNFKLLFERLGRPGMTYFDTESPGLGLEGTGLVSGYLEPWSKGIAKSFGFIYNLPRYGHTSLVHPDYTPDVGAVAFATMTRFLEGARMEGPLTPGPGVRAYSLLKEGERIVVAWSEVPDKELAAQVHGADHTFDFQGNAGPKVTPGEYGINSVRVGNDPVYIFCKLDLDLKGISHNGRK